jgi:hypothetical protein
LIRLRLFTECQAVVDAVTTGVRSVHEGLWLGLLDHPHLRAVTDQRYEMWRTYGADDHNLSGLMPWEESALDRFFGGCGSLLVGAAGGGREVLALARQGYRVTAFDCSEHLLNRCRRLLADEGLAVSAAVSPPDHVPDGVGQSDGAIIGWGGYMHIPGRPARVNFMQQIRSHLPPGGPCCCPSSPTGNRPDPIGWWPASPASFVASGGVVTLSRSGTGSPERSTTGFVKR